MDSSDFPVSKSPRKELQGPRPAPLKVRKDSYKIKKPPVAPPPPDALPRPPVIIYSVSPKVIHTNPNDFMTLVQRLTGSDSSSTASFSSASASASTSTSAYDLLSDSTGEISPAARYACIEKTKPQPTERNKKLEDANSGFVDQAGIERSSLFPGILSPAPTSLPTIPPSFFSPPSDPNTFSFLHDFSPVLLGNKNFIEGGFMPSPSSFISPYLTSPTTPSIDLFNNFFDF